MKHLSLSQVASGVMILLTIVAPVVSHADWTDASAESIAIAQTPLKGSEIDRRDTELLLKAQQTRTNEDCSIGERQSIPTMNAFWGDHRILTDTEFQRAKDRIEKVAKFAERVANFYKRKSGRARPAVEDPRIKPCISNPPTGEKSYPSSHAAIATATGCVLAQMYPEKKNQILPYAEYISNLRFIIGVHHPSDVEAGKQIGQSVCRLAH